MFSLPLLQVGLDKKSLTKVRKQHPAQYEKIAETKSGICRFYSNFESTDVSEFVLNNVELPENCTFLHKIDDHWYFLFIENGSPQQQKIVTLNELFTSFGYELTQSEHIYCPENDAIASDYFNAFQDKIFHIEPLDFSQCDEKFLLPKNQTSKKKSLLLVGFAILVLGGLAATLINQPEKKAVVHVDPLEQYKQHFFSSVVASEGFDLAFKATAYGLLLPQDWVFANTLLDGNSIVLNYEASPNGSMNKTMKAFTIAHPSIKDAWSEVEQTFRWPIKSPTTLTIPTLRNIYELRDTLINLGFSVKQEELTTMSQVNRYQLIITKANANFIELKTLAALTQNTPTYLSELKIQNGLSLPLVNITAQMTLEGKFND